MWHRYKRSEGRKIPLIFENDNGVKFYEADW